MLCSKILTLSGHIFTLDGHDPRRTESLSETAFLPEMGRVFLFSSTTILKARIKAGEEWSASGK